MLIASCARSSSAHDAVLLHAEPGDAHLDDVSRLNVARRLHAVRDAGRGARGDDVAGAQRHEATDVGHELPHGEDHVLGISALAILAVDGCPHVEPLRIVHLVSGDQPRPDRRERVAALALRRRAAVLHLEGTLGEVIDDAVGSYVLHRVRLSDVAGIAADHRAELDLVIELDALEWANDRVVRPVDRAVRLDEEERLLRQRQAHLLSVIRVIEPDADDLADSGERATESRPAANHRKSRRFDRAQSLEPGRGERVSRDVLDHSGQVAHDAVLVDEPGLFSTSASVAYELHEAGPPFERRFTAAFPPRRAARPGFLTSARRGTFGGSSFYARVRPHHRPRSCRHAAYAEPVPPDHAFRRVASTATARAPEITAFPHQYHCAPLKPRQNACPTIVTKKRAESSP